MPLARYFLYVGGVLLTLVFILDACLTKLPVMERAQVNSPIIRIHSERKWPERIGFDNTLSTIVPAHTAIVDDRVSSPATVAANASIQCEAAGTIHPGKARTEAATATQNCEAARDAAFATRREAAAVWLVW